MPSATWVWLARWFGRKIPADRVARVARKLCTLRPNGYVAHGVQNSATGMLAGAFSADYQGGPGGTVPDCVREELFDFWSFWSRRIGQPGHFMAFRVDLLRRWLRPGGTTRATGTARNIKRKKV